MAVFSNSISLQLRRRAATTSLCLCLVLSGVTGCADNVIPAWDAQVRINTAYEAKLKQCDQSGPSLLLLVPNDVQEPDVVLCEGELLAASCPILETPGSCLLLLFKAAPEDDVDGM